MLYNVNLIVWAINPGSYDKQTIVIPPYDHITNCHMTIPYSIMYVYKFMYQQYSYMKTCIIYLYMYCKNNAVGHVIIEPLKN